LLKLSNYQQLNKYYCELANTENCHFLDAWQFVKVSDDDGIHLDADSHKALAVAISEKIKGIF
jgi:hypothetical protein